MKILLLVVMFGVAISSHGCLLAAAGAGAAGGVYVDKNYDISIDKKKSDEKEEENSD